MLSANGTISISINIGKHDQDIASWFNLLAKSGQSRSMWASALLLAYSQGNYLETGCVLSAPEPFTNYHQKQQGPQKQAVLLGSGNSQQRKKVRKYGWTVKSSTGEFIIGSVVTLRLTNKNIIAIYWTLREKNIPISMLIKDMIRKGLRYGDIEVAPNPALAKNMLSACHIPSYHMNLRPANMTAVSNHTISQTDAVLSTSSTSSSEPVKSTTSPLRNPLLDFI